jgi:mono/diheme cytochrome c family protein
VNAEPTPDPNNKWGFFEQYCEKCHNSTDWAGGVAFDAMSADSVGDDAKELEEAVRKLQGRLMPPPGKPQPDQQTVDNMVAWLTTRLDEAGGTHPNPGSVVIHRLNRTEYAREVRDLLALNIDAAALLPRDTKGEGGFDNVASVLKVSPSFLDQYIVAAHDVSVQAIGSNVASVAPTVYRSSPENSQEAHIEGLPLGTRGGLLVEHLFPADGEYTFNINQGGSFGGGYITGLDSKQTLIMTIDGEQVFEGSLGGPQDLKQADQKQAPAVKEIRARFDNIHAKVSAGPHKIGIAFIARSMAESDDKLQPLGSGGQIPRQPGVLGFEVLGPAKPTGISDTPSRARIFICYPKNESEEYPCAQQIVANLARRAYRRPVGEADLAAPLRFYKAGREKHGFEGGIQEALMALLASPKFLYRVEALPQSVSAGAAYRISDLELASRLSFFLWSQGPDEELLNVAGSGKLHEAGVLEKQVRRMLADRRAGALVTNFADEWLNVDEVDRIEPDPSLFPEFDGPLRAAFKRETELFVGSVLTENQSVVNLLDANYTFVNERLAREYGIPNIQGEQFRRVTLTDPNRFGLLGKGSFLMGTSYANRTSPVKRGAWILENITGTPPHAPPPGVEALKENMDGVKAKTVRERMEAHRSNPSCNQCHGILDPLGFAFENFDAIGGWRNKDHETATVIDAGGELGGVPLHGPADVRQMLMRKPQQFALTFTEKLFEYSLGRGLEYTDMPTVRAIVRDAGKDNYRFVSIVLGIVDSPSFQMQMVPDGSAPGTAPVKQASLQP